MDYLLHFFFWDPVTSFHFIWGMYKMYVSWVLSLETGQAPHTKTISRSASPKSTWPSCSPTVRRAFTNSLGMTSDDVTRHPGKLTLCGFKSSRLTLEPWTIYGAHGVDRFTNSRRHGQLRGRLCCNIFTHKMFSLNISSWFQQENYSMCCVFLFVAIHLIMVHIILCLFQDGWWLSVFNSSGFLFVFGNPSCTLWPSWF